MKITRILPRLLAALLATLPLFAQPPSSRVGIFTLSQDIGATKPGSTIYERGSKSYRITGGGADLWGKEDQFRFAWITISGDAFIEADVSFPADDVVPKEKAMLIFRQSLAPDAAYADLAIHGDGHSALQFRKVDGGFTEDLTATEHGSKRLRIERKGDHFTAYLGDSEATMKPVLSTDVTLHDSVLMGLGVCAHDAGGLHTAIFSNVRVTKDSGYANLHNHVE